MIRARDEDVLVSHHGEVRGRQSVHHVTGTTYGLHEIGNGTSTQRLDNGANVFQQTIEGHENAQGNLPDLVIHAEMHQKIDATGRYHMSIEHVTFGCRTHGTP